MIIGKSSGSSIRDLYDSIVVEPLMFSVFWLTVCKGSSEERAARIRGASILLLANGGGSFTLFSIDPRGQLDSFRHQPHRHLFATVHRPMATDPSTSNCSSPFLFLLIVLSVHLSFFHRNIPHRKKIVTLID